MDVRDLKEIDLRIAPLYAHPDIRLGVDYLARICDNWKYVRFSRNSGNEFIIHYVLNSHDTYSIVTNRFNQRIGWTELYEISEYIYPPPPTVSGRKTRNVRIR